MQSLLKIFSRVRKNLLQAALLLLTLGTVHAQTVTEFGGLTSGSHPMGANGGSDGNIWITYVSAAKISKMTTAGVVTHYTAGISGSLQQDICAGPDGNMWFTVADTSKIGRITPTGTVTEFALSFGSNPFGIVPGPDGNMWFTEGAGNKVGKITMAGVITEYSTGISPNSWPGFIVVGPDGNLWFTEIDGNRIGRITTAGVVTEFSTGITAGANPSGLAVGTDGNLWFTERAGNRIGRITMAGVITEFSAGITGNNIVSIVAGADGNLWFPIPSNDNIGRITTAGVITEFTPAQTGITPGSVPYIMGLGPDGRLWFSEGGTFVDRIGSLSHWPNAPVIGTASSGDTQATVTFTAPAFPGSSPITGYTVTSSPAGGIDSNAGSTGLSHVITGLVNGTAYTFTVTATNIAGTGAASAPSNSVTPATTPGAPTIGTATSGNAQATVPFTAPASNGGSAITGYTVTSSPAGGTDSTAGTTGLSHVITGLVNGTAYTFTVKATNIAGTGAASAPSNSVTPYVPYSVTYNGNGNTGGSVPVDGATYATGATVPVLGNSGTLVKTGSAFAGWNTSANGSGTARAAGTTFAMGASNVTLFAQWSLTPINGSCGSANASTSAYTPATNLCTAGSASAVTPILGSYGWSCAGSNGGTTATCSANWQQTGSGSGLGTSSASGAGWAFTAPGTGPMQSSGFIAVTGHPKSPPNLPSGYQFPQGLYDFVLTGGAAGSTASVTITYPSALPSGTVYWKYGPSPLGNNCSAAACAAPHWYQFPAVISGNTVTLSITDGGLGDDDLIANGVIVDQGGPGVPTGPVTVAPIPTLSQWGMLALIGLLGVFGLAGMRRKLG